MKKIKLLSWAIALGFFGSTAANASDVGVDIPAGSYDFESAPDNDWVIQRMGTKIGYVKAESAYEYWGYEDFDFSGGATHLTVRASCAAPGATLKVRLKNHYNVTLTLATVKITDTLSWDNFQDFTVEIDQAVLQQHGGGRLFFVVEQDDYDGYILDVDSFRFDNVADVTLNAVDYAAESYPSNDDIIRGMDTKVGYITDMSWLRFNNVNVDGAVSMSVLASSASGGGTIYVTKNAPMIHAAAEIVGVVEVSNTGGWDTFQVFSENLDEMLEGNVNALYLNFEGESDFLFDLEAIKFSKEPVTDVGVDINAGTYAAESAPGDEDTIRDIGNGVGYIKAESGTEYWRYDNLKLESGATTLTVRAASGFAGGTLHVRLANHYNVATTIATVEITNTGGWDSFQDFTVPINQEVLEQLSGRSLFFVVTDDETTDYQFDIQSFRFDN